MLYGSAASIGKMRERITIEDNVPDALAVSSVTRAITTATVTTSTAHGLASGDYVTIAGASPAGYNTDRKQVSVTAATTFTYQVSSGLTTPATGAITVTYLSDAQGNRKAGWDTFVEVSAEVMPISSQERLAVAAIPALASSTQYRFRIAARADVTDQMRIRWVPRWPPNSPEHVLEIVGVLPEGDGRRYAVLECIG